jgi:malate synthase
LRGVGCVPLYDLMEDAATAEISRTQIWQWIRHKATLADGREVTPELLKSALEEEMAALRQVLPAEAFDKGRFAEAVKIFTDMCLADTLEEFLTLPAYRVLE